MKVSINWLKELVNLKLSTEELSGLLSLKTIGTKEVTDGFIELDMKGYNRADLLSLRGIAYEVAAITNSLVTFSESEIKKYELPEIKVDVKDNTLVPLYCLVKIEGLKVEASSPEWIKKLADSGMRSVNNIADITNLVMLEYGQPLHAFDAASVKNEKIIVRLSMQGESLQTLDNKKRDLVSTDLVIADSDKILGIAGVMGGQNSEITDSTTSILLEAAIFGPTTLRKTASRLGLNSEASKRFQHGLTKKRLLQALDAATQMYQDLGGKITAVSITGDTTDPKRSINLSHKKVKNLIGVEINSEQVEEYLKKLNFDFVSNEDGWEVTTPYFRLDIIVEEDLIEEIARIYGYNKVPSVTLEGEVPEVTDPPILTLINNLRTNLVQLGLTEVQTYSYYSTQTMTNLGWNEHTKYLIRIANPMSKETEYLRQHIWQNLIEVIDKNLRQGIKDIAVFEIGKIFYPEENNIPKEEYRLSVMISNGSDQPIQELHAIYQKLKEKLNLPEAEVSPIPDIPIIKDFFHPNRFLSITKAGKVIGGISELHPKLLDKYGINQRVAMFEINIEKLLEN